METRPRASWIDICKGIAMIGVVIVHIKSSFNNSGLLSESILVKYLGALNISFVMPLFFVISGYLFGKAKKGSVKHEICKRAASYGIPYLIHSFLGGARKLLLAEFVNNKVSIKDLLLTILIPRTGLWFLYALLVISVVQVIVSRHARGSRSRAVVLIVAIGLKVGTYWLSHVQTEFPFYELGITDAAKYFMWFVIGEYYAPDFIDVLKERMKRRSSGMVLLLSAISYAVLIGFLRKLNAKYLVIDLVMALAGCVLVMAFSMRLGRCAPLETVGRNTMPIYLLHALVIAVLRIIMRRLGVPMLGGITPLVICGISGVVIPYAVYSACKNIKPFDFCFYPWKYLKKIGKERDSDEHRQV